MSENQVHSNRFVRYQDGKKCRYRGVVDWTGALFGVIAAIGLVFGSSTARGAADESKSPGTKVEVGAKSKMSGKINADTGAYKIDITGKGKSQHVVEASTNLGEWESIRHVKIEGESKGEAFLDFESRAKSSRFYRVGLSVEKPPQKKNGTVGGNADFSVEASGSSDLTYEWRLNGKPLEGSIGLDGFNVDGAASANLSLQNLTDVSVGTLEVVIKNESGATISSKTILDVGAQVSLPEITAEPEDEVVEVGQKAEFAVDAQAKGQGDLTFQWRLNGEPLENSARISGATSSELTISETTKADAGAVDVVVDNGSSAAISSSGDLVVTGEGVLPKGPILTLAPSDFRVEVGGSANFRVEAEGEGELSYEWFHNGMKLNNNAEVSGAASASLTMENVEEADAGSVKVVVTDESGATVESSANLEVSGSGSSELAIISPPENKNVSSGTTVSFSVEAEGSGSLDYQWFHNGNELSNEGNVSGATSATLTLESVTTVDGGTYKVVVTDTTEAQTESVVTLTVL